ncbi:MAG: oxygen-dependent coproporphyrinogen oxidase [Bacteroidetes bacterium]|nr:oxygen-dependent coproporphyrinogen oxidase [Bacteroidota bacterium]
MSFKIEIEEYFRSLQSSICNGLEQLDGQQKFLLDAWNREEGGGGITRVIQNGAAIEKGAVNFSAVHGALSAQMKQFLKVDSESFYASGVSIIMHPSNPWVPIIHMNVRYFELDENTYWFGGGIDVTPHYINKEDAHFFHSYLKNVCDNYHSQSYAKFKNWADEYFFLKHRNETRGIGGIFFDRLTTFDNKSTSDTCNFVKHVGNSFVDIYSTLVNRNRHKEFASQEKDWQYLRRGRYVEFNLLFDQGTKFGVESNGRTESILLSLPPMAGWQYNYTPLPNTKEAQTQALLKKGIDWLGN